MYVNKITLSDFRNYERAEAEFSRGTNIIYGSNAQGKTNLLEAVYMFSQGRSPRTKFDRELIRFGADMAAASLEFEDSRRRYRIVMKILKNGKKLIKINNVPVARLSRLMNYLNVVMFSPGDLDIVKGAPGIRRKFMDSAVSQMYPSYLNDLIEYHKTLSQKNSFLRQMKKSNIKSDPTLDIWNEGLAAVGARIAASRRQFVKKIGSLAQKAQKEISGEILEISYIPNISAETAEEMLEFLRANAEREIELGASNYGIQRDDMRFVINGANAALFGSQGQQRTAVLSLKLAQADYIKAEKDEYPVMLLDDIMSELDFKRRAYLAGRIRDKQVILTCTDPEVTAENTGRRFYVEKGTIEREDGSVSSHRK